jgi:methylmalonyl-CoA mutase N-terminal domain/subunit
MFDKKKIKDIESEFLKWQEGKNQNKDASSSCKTCLTNSGEEVNSLYTPLDISETDYNKDLGYPGEYPFTRGIYKDMYRGKFWTMRQYAGFGSARTSNLRYKYLLSQGQTGLSIAFDLPTQIGYDSDHPMSKGEVGKVGVAIDSLADMEILFDGIPLDKVSTSMTINSSSIVLLAMYIALGKKNNIPLHKLKGTIQNDILKEYAARGTYIFPPKQSMKLITDIFSYCSENLPNWNTISISGYHIREAGSTAVQEVAFTLANGIAYVQAAVDKGLDVNIFGKRLSFFFNAGTDVLEEVAKFRAARRLWAKIMKERFGVTDEQAMLLRFHTQTSGASLTAQQADNNIVRVTLQALSAILGGTQSLHTNSRDEALALPSEDSVQIALRTQQIIAHESGVVNTCDPLAGSFFIEEMTNTIERKAEEYIKKIDEMGGAVSSIEKGFMQKEIQQSAFDWQRSIENQTRTIVGVNKFIVKEEKNENLLILDPEMEFKQKEVLSLLKAKRNNIKVKECLEEISTFAKSGKNLMEPVLEAVTNYVTVGEICDVLRDVYGEYKEQIYF